LNRNLFASILNLSCYYLSIGCGAPEANIPGEPIMTLFAPLFAKCAGLRDVPVISKTERSEIDEATLILNEYNELHRLISHREWKYLIHHLKHVSNDSGGNFIGSNNKNCTNSNRDVPPIILNESPLPRSSTIPPDYLLQALAHIGVPPSSCQTSTSVAPKSPRNIVSSDLRSKGVEYSRIRNQGNSFNFLEVKKLCGTPLRMAIRQHAPPHVIAALLHLFPGAAAIRHIRPINGYDQQTSLENPSSSSCNLSSSTGSHSSVKKSNLKSPPLQLGDLPLHEAAKRSTSAKCDVKRTNHSLHPTLKPVNKGQRSKNSKNKHSPSSSNKPSKRTIEALDIFSYLIACHPPSVVSRDGYGRTPLHIALCHGASGRNPRVMEVLCRRLSWEDFERTILEEEQLMKGSRVIQNDHSKEMSDRIVYDKSKQENGGVDSARMKHSMRKYHISTSKSKLGEPKNKSDEKNDNHFQLNVVSTNSFEETDGEGIEATEIGTDATPERKYNTSMVILSSKLASPPLPSIPHSSENWNNIYFSSPTISSPSRIPSTSPSIKCAHSPDFDGTLPCNATIIPDAMHGLLPINYAVMNGAPIESIRYLKRLYPDSLKIGDRWGRTPLHWFLGAGDVDLSLADVNDADNIDSTSESTMVGSPTSSSGNPSTTRLKNEPPVVRSAQLFTELLSPDTASLKDGTAHQRTPLHWAVRLIALGIARKKEATSNRDVISLACIRSIIAMAGPSILTSMDGDGRTPLSLLLCVLKFERESEEVTSNSQSQLTKKWDSSRNEYDVPLDLIEILCESDRPPYLWNDSAMKVTRNSRTPPRRGSPTEQRQHIFSAEAGLRASSLYDNLGHLPLHYAVSAICPPLIVHYLVKSYPPALHIAVLGTGWTPLHMAFVSPFVASNITTSILEALLLPLNPEWAHINCDDSAEEETNHIAAGLRSLTIRDCFGQTPLHLATRNNASLDVLRILISGYEDATRQVDNTGNLPAHLAVDESMFMSIEGSLDDDESFSANIFGRSMGWISDDVEAKWREERNTLRTKLCWLIRPLLQYSGSISRTCSTHGLTALHLSIAFNACPYEMVRAMLRIAPEAAQIRTKSCGGLTPIELHQLRRQFFAIEVTLEEMKSWNAIQELLFAHYPLIRWPMNKCNIINWEPRRDKDLLARCVQIIKDECSGLGSFHSNPQSDPTIPSSARIGSEVFSYDKRCLPEGKITPQVTNIFDLHAPTFDAIEAVRSEGSPAIDDPTFSFDTSGIDSLQQSTFSSGYTDESGITTAGKDRVGNTQIQTNGFVHLTIVTSSFDKDTPDPIKACTNPVNQETPKGYKLIQLDHMQEINFSDVACRLWTFFMTYANRHDPTDTYAEQIKDMIDGMHSGVVRQLARMPLNKNYCLIDVNDLGRDDSSVIDCTGAKIRSLVSEKIQSDAPKFAKISVECRDDKNNK